MSKCLRCLTALNRQGWSKEAFRTWQMSFREQPRHTQIRQMGWLSSFFTHPERNEPPPNVQNTTAAAELEPAKEPKVSPAKSAEEILQSALEEKKARTTVREKKPPEPRKITLRETVRKQLEEWHETEPIDLAPPEGFQDPLGHLSDNDQIAYLHSPPPEYLETLERRTTEREDYEKHLYLSNPVQYWPLACSTKPDYSDETIKPWVPWSQEKRKEVMEKFRRYDQRIQARYRTIYKHFDGQVARQAARKRLLAKIQSNVHSTAKTKKEKNRATAKLTPPKEVFEVMIRRDVIRSRNNALLEAQKTAFEELTRFVDITEQGEILSMQTKWKRQLVREARLNKEDYKVWSSMGPRRKAESVDWTAIHGEV